MRPTNRTLVMRDPALAAIYGMGGQADFGADADERDAYESRGLANVDATHGAYTNARALDIDANQLSLEQHLAHKLMEQRDATRRRLAMLDPNEGSTEKIGRYTFSISQTFVLGAPEGISMTNSPLSDIKPERLIFNAPAYTFALISTVQMGNVSVIIGGNEDAYNYSAVAVDVRLSMPLLRTSSRALVAGEYSGLAPTPFTAGNEFPFVATFHGPARMIT